MTLQTGSIHYNQEVHTIDISAARSSGVASPELIAEAVTYLHRDGILVLENAVDPAHIDELEQLLVPEAVHVQNQPDHKKFNWNKGNIDQVPPPIPHLMFDDVWAHPIVTSICSAILGRHLVCHYANGNTAIKSTKRQPVHADIYKPHPMYPFAYDIGIPLCDMSADNGSTEVWIGSHRESNITQHTVNAKGTYDFTIKPEILEKRRQHSPPVQPHIKRGSIILRDLRLFHAGMPNRTAEPRVMLAFVIQPKWFQAPLKVSLPLKAKALVDQWQEQTGLEFAARWVDGDVDHRLASPSDLDFSTGNSKLLELESMMYPRVY